MADNPKQGLRIIFEVIRTGKPPRRASVHVVWWRWLLALLGAGIGIYQLFYG